MVVASIHIPNNNEKNVSLRIKASYNLPNTRMFGIFYNELTFSKHSEMLEIVQTLYQYQWLFCG